MAEQLTQVLGIVSISNKGEYNSQTSYEKLNVVTYQGSTYCAKQNCKGVLPTDTDYWQLYAEKGDQGPTGPQGPKPVKGVDYYTTADKEELEANLSSDIHDEIAEQLGDLTSATPLAAASIDDMTDTTRIYVNTTDGYWYYYNGSTWVQGDVYQATSVPDGSITSKKLKNDILKSQNMKYLLSRYNINSLENVKSYNLMLYASGDVRSGDGTRLTSAGYLSFTNNPIFKPMSPDVEYFVNVYREKSKQENSYDFSDLDLEFGTINSSGVPSSGAYQIRTSDFIEVDSATLFEPDVNNYTTVTRVSPGCA